MQGIRGLLPYTLGATTAQDRSCGQATNHGGSLETKVAAIFVPPLTAPVGAWSSYLGCLLPLPTAPEMSTALRSQLKFPYHSVGTFLATSFQIASLSNISGQQQSSATVLHMNLKMKEFMQMLYTVRILSLLQMKRGREGNGLFVLTSSKSDVYNTIQMHTIPKIVDGFSEVLISS